MQAACVSYIPVRSPHVVGIIIAKPNVVEVSRCWELRDVNCQQGTDTDEKYVLIK
jgi:hypothetical protein